MSLALAFALARTLALTCYSRAHSHSQLLRVRRPSHRPETDWPDPPTGIISQSLLAGGKSAEPPPAEQLARATSPKVLRPSHLREELFPRVACTESLTSRPSPSIPRRPKSRLPLFFFVIAGFFLFSRCCQGQERSGAVVSVLGS